MKEILNYITHSQLSLTFQLNPRQWDLYYKQELGSTYMDPGLIYNGKLNVLMFELNIVIDDGSW